MLKETFNLDITTFKLIKISQKVENEFIGVETGIMDQFIVGYGEKNKAVLLDTTTLEYTMIPIDLKDYKFIIMDSNKQRKLTESNYNLRHKECKQALLELQEFIPISFLTELTPKKFDEYRKYLSSSKLEKRVQHVMNENIRTKNAAKALIDEDLKKFGLLMNESHISLRDNYEVTGKELDTLVEAAWSQKGTLGARMTGAGFGGSAIALVLDTQIKSFIKNVRKEYKMKIGYFPDFYITEISDGAKIL